MDADVGQIPTEAGFEVLPDRVAQRLALASIQRVYDDRG
jgi:hypothetical protein